MGALAFLCLDAPRRACDGRRSWTGWSRGQRRRCTGGAGSNPVPFQPLVSARRRPLKGRAVQHRGPPTLTVDRPGKPDRSGTPSPRGRGPNGGRAVSRGRRDGIETRAHQTVPRRWRGRAGSRAWLRRKSPSRRHDAMGFTSLPVAECDRRNSPLVCSGNLPAAFFCLDARACMGHNARHAGQHAHPPAARDAPPPEGRGGTAGQHRGDACDGGNRGLPCAASEMTQPIPRQAPSPAT